MMTVELPTQRRARTAIVKRPRFISDARVRESIGIDGLNDAGELKE